jgi:ribonuclease HII
MMEYRRHYPEYGFEHHKGYATAADFAALGRTSQSDQELGYGSASFQ